MTYKIPFIKAVNGLRNKLDSKSVLEQEIIPKFVNFAIRLGLKFQNYIKESLLLDQQININNNDNEIQQQKQQSFKTTII